MVFSISPKKVNIKYVTKFACFITFFMLFLPVSSKRANFWFSTSFFGLEGIQGKITRIFIYPISLDFWPILVLCVVKLFIFYMCINFGDHRTQIRHKIFPFFVCHDFHIGMGWNLVKLLLAPSCAPKPKKMVKSCCFRNN